MARNRLFATLSHVSDLLLWSTLVQFTALSSLTLTVRKVIDSEYAVCVARGCTDGIGKLVHAIEKSPAGPSTGERRLIVCTCGALA
jgi:hypothetical protein